MRVADELERVLAISQSQADEREAAAEWAAAVEAAEAADVEAAAPPEAAALPPVVPHEAECVVCMDAPPSHILIPCGHVCVCAACAERCTDITRECPICREPAQQAIRAYCPPNNAA